MPFTLFTNLLARVPFSKPSGSTANKIKDSFAKPSAHSPRNSGTVDILLSLQRRPRIKRNVEPRAQWRHAEYIYPSVVLAGSPSPPIATAHVAPPQDSEEAMEGLNGLMLRKFKKQLPADGQIRVVPAHGSLVAIVRCGGPKGWNIDIKDPKELNQAKAEFAFPSASPSPTPTLSQEHLEVIKGLNRMLVRKYKKSLPENGETIMVPAHGAVMARLRCGGPDGWAAQINPDLALQVV